MVSVEPTLRLITELEMKRFERQKTYRIILFLVLFILFFSLILLIILFAYPSSSSSSSSDITTTDIIIATSEPNSTTKTLLLDWTVTNPIVTDITTSNNTQPELTTEIPPDISKKESNILFQVNSTTICDDELTCISMNERPDNQNRIVDIRYSSSDKNTSVSFNITRHFKILGKIQFKESYSKDDNEADPGCQPRKIFIPWATVKGYIVRYTMAAIPGTWIGQPLEVLRCHNSLDPCQDGVYCSVQIEEERETTMELFTISSQKIANLTVYFVQDGKCECAINKPDTDYIFSPPFIYNATVLRFHD